jgi:ATP-dependent exoDNAse (exonuclease V) beta subunit
MSAASPSCHTLALKHPHERDARISFEEGPHIYTIDGDSNYMSVTTWNHKHFEQFDADAIITKMMSGANWTRSKYHGKTREEIKAQWEENRDAAATAGTALHYDIECYYNGMDVENDSVEYNYFREFVADNRGLVPYRTEWMVWDAELRFAGSIDMVFANEDDGTLLIYDWKRSKEIRKTSPWSKFAHTECVNHLPDTNFWHYSLQLNTYKALIEKNYGKTVSRMALVCLHPDQSRYKVLAVPDLQAEVRDLFALRKAQLRG